MTRPTWSGCGSLEMRPSPSERLSFSQRGERDEREANRTIEFGQPKDRD